MARGNKEIGYADVPKTTLGKCRHDVMLQACEICSPRPSRTRNAPKVTDGAPSISTADRNNSY
jgi:hypothetical protein